ncbi:MAG: helicase [Deltaproteobacteria bacterium HGW-Deltaproteobacteria-14]|jgi:ATP-dependent helicase HrpB|nr:MAG: helicase [Deltaproteobacteria bacterium HGW-Deltaproteobacteria-14]
MSRPQPLPIDTLRDAFDAALAAGPVVVTAPTGSGKSTRVPCWCPAPVLVIEPRRVACRSLARRVAELEGTSVGGGVGYHVRDDRRASADTRILFATPGVALRWLAGGAPLPFATVILDELHERSLDVDLLLALLLARSAHHPARRPPHLVAMSATLDAERVAAHLGARLLDGEGRQYPVAIAHIGAPTAPPSAHQLAERVAEAVARAEADPGDILVFLPGKAEIATVADHLDKRCPHELLPLHGGLTAQEQDRAFSPGSRRRVILATNVAETSLTLPRIGVVIDAGLVRRTRYHRGRGVLTLAPIADDSAEQRAGRAGRLGPGACYRLWGRGARLDPVTPPEIARESLVPLVLGAAACGEDAGALPWLDPPADHAVAQARRELEGLGAITADGAVTPSGLTLFGWPLDPGLGRILIVARERASASASDSGDARERASLDDAIDLVAALGVDRSMFGRERPQHPEDDLRATGCDAVALIRAVRLGDVRVHRLDPRALDEARALRQRLHQLLLSGEPPPSPDAAIDRSRLAQTLLAADPLCAHVARRRRGRVTWANGGTELSLGRESAVDGEKAEAILVLSERAVGEQRSAQLLATAAMPAPIPWLVAAGVGTDRVTAPSLARDVVVASVERVHAGRVLGVTERRLSGAQLREATAALFARGSYLRGAAAEARARLAAWALCQRLAAAPGLPDRDLFAALTFPEELSDAPEVETLARARLDALGLEEAEDLQLVTRADLLPPPIPAAALEVLDRDFPRVFTLPDASYRIDYDLVRRTATLVQATGSRKTAPSLTLLPPFRGFSVRVQRNSAVTVLR